MTISCRAICARSAAPIGAGHKEVTCNLPQLAFCQLKEIATSLSLLDVWTPSSYEVRLKFLANILTESIHVPR